MPRKNDFDALQNPLNRPWRCEYCDGMMEIEELGRYRCQKCGHRMFDDFGKVKLFLEDLKNQGMSIQEVAAATGVGKANVQLLLKNGRVEYPDFESDILRCEGCGKEIKYGRRCASCARELSNNLKAAFTGKGAAASAGQQEAAGRKPKVENPYEKSTKSAKARFMGKSRKRRG